MSHIFDQNFNVRVNSGRVAILQTWSFLRESKKRCTHAINNFECLSNAERLTQLDLFSLKGSILHVDLIFVWKIFHGLSALSPKSLFQVITCNVIRGHSFKTYVTRTRLDLRYRFLSEHIIKTWKSHSLETALAELLSLC